MQRSEVRENRTAVWREQRAEVRGQGEPDSRNSHLTQGARGTQKERKRFVVLPETWNLEPETLWRGQNAEVRGQGEPNSRNSRTAF